MRTTVEFDPNTGKAVEELRRDQGIGVSQAVNEFVRRGMSSSAVVRPFHQRTRRLGLTVDLSNVADALDNPDGPAGR